MAGPDWIADTHEGSWRFLAGVVLTEESTAQYLKRLVLGAPFRMARRSRLMQPLWHKRRLKQMTQHWRRAPLLFVHISKTGGTSVSRALGAPHTMHQTALEMRNRLGADVWASKTSFAVVRNPFDRVVSQYHYELKTNENGLADSGIGFAEWVHLAFEDQDPRFHTKPRFYMPQCDWISDNGALIVSDVARFEALDTDVERIAQNAGAEVSLPHLNRSDRGEYRAYYDARTRGVAEQYFRLDFELFGYNF